MSSDKPENETNDQFEFLFGRSALLEGEDEERYLRLRAAVVDELKPKTVFDWINAKDHVDKLWEEQRYKRAATALINGAMLKALEYYFKDICETPYLDDSALNYSAPEGGSFGTGEIWDHHRGAPGQGRAARKRWPCDVRSHGGGARKRPPHASQGGRAFSRRQGDDPDEPTES